MSARVAELMITARRCGRLPLLLRAMIALGVAGAIAATTVPAWDLADAYLVIAVIAGVVGIVAPDTGAAAFASGALIVGWMAGSPGGVGPAVIVAGLCLLVVHVASAMAAAMPITARGDPRLALRWAGPTVVLGAGTVAAAGVVALLDRWSPPGSIVLVLLALAVLAAGAWWLTTGSGR
jgi:hypothetical protein